MNFNSLSFLIFFPIVTLVYFIINHKYRWLWLLVASYYFYMCWNPKYALLIATSTVITYLSGIFISKFNKIENKAKSKRLKLITVTISLLSNLGILFLFKYFNFTINILSRLFSDIGVTISLPTVDLLLPVGISFYTFQALSYTVDIYRGNVEAERNLGKYALFVSFFPQLVAGPIEKSKDLLYQFNEIHTFDYNRAKEGIMLMVWGLFQKMVVGDRLAIVVNEVYNNPTEYKGLEILIATIFFAFQIYCDFSSYSTIALGAAKVMGFRLSKNFDSPYFSTSIKMFWRRWHITLGAWFKDYLYIPLGGNRKGKIRTYINIMIIFLASGLWHGASINFVIWGGLHGLYQVIGDIIKPLKNKVTIYMKVDKSTFSYKLLQVIITFLLVCFAWIFFRANSFADAKILINNLFEFNPWILTDSTLFSLGLDSKEFILAVIGVIAIIAIDLLKGKKNIIRSLSNQNIIFRWSIYFALIFIILIFGVYGPDYSQQQFIYFQF